MNGLSALGECERFIEKTFPGRICSRLNLAEQPARTRPFPGTLSPLMVEALRQVGIYSLYEHQSLAYEAIRQGKNVVQVSQTASGKTLSFLLPIIEDYLSNDRKASTLLLYPTKALSRDQENTLVGLLTRLLTDKQKVGTFDGDSSRESRTTILDHADFLISNPDMLHSGIMPNHARRFKKFLARLRYIVVDEVHAYRGAFGSHVSNVFRRLLRICALHGSTPQLICSSATIGNPKEHVEALFHREFQVIDLDGSPKPTRTIYFINPPLIVSRDNTPYRKGPGSISIPLIRHAAKQNIRTICFCRARQEVERLYKAVIKGNGHLTDKVKPYRGGLLPSERRQLERDLFEGKLTTIITTNALELGINIGDLDLCILSGHPGTIASFWQQAGRVGRNGKAALIVFIAKDNPIDQYLVNHSEFLTDRPIERAWLSADNPYIMLQHLPCAAYEHPLAKSEQYYGEPTYSLAIEILTKRGSLKPYHDLYRYAEQDYPARGVSLRGMTDYNVEIFCGSEVIGELDPIGARGTLYKDAIYQHLGRRYLCLDLDLDKKLCRVDPVEVDYYTEAVWEVRVTMTAEDDRLTINDCNLVFGVINANKQPKLYKKIREGSYENIGYGPITLAPFEYDSTGFSFEPAKAWQDELRKTDKRFIDIALFGLRYILRRTAPSLCMADIKDIHTDIALAESISGDYRCALYLYDALEGGVGFSEKIFDNFVVAIALCGTIIAECGCGGGCPSCVPPLPEGIDDEEMANFLITTDSAVRCTQSLIELITTGRISVPQISSQRHRRNNLPPVKRDVELSRLTTRLNRAADILGKKRERVH